MKASKVVCVIGSLVVAAIGEQAQTDPLGKVLDLMDELSAKVTKAGETEAKAFKEYFEWCDDAAKNADYAIETATAQKEKLEAKIAMLTSAIEVSISKIEDHAAAIAQAEAERKNATLIREREAEDFAAGEQELMTAIDTISRAIGILEKEMVKNPAALAQVDTTNMASLVQALRAVLDAAAFPGSDQRKLVAFVQSRQGAQDEDLELSAPAAATYTSQSGGIVEVLEDMKEKAETELSDMRKAETNEKHNYAMLKQSLEDQEAADTKDMSDEKAAKAASEEAKATAESELEMTSKDLAQSKEERETAHSTCMQVAADHEQTVASRTQELKALAEAKKVLEETSSDAVSQTYSFLQMAAATRMRTQADLARSEVITMVKRLAKNHHSAALAQLASRIAAVVKLGSVAGEDPFTKVKGLIKDMIAKLQKEANDEAEEKAYCDEQMSKTEAKKAELEEDTAKLKSKIDLAVARKAELEEQVKELEGELAALAKEQAEMDKIRQATHADYETAKADLELGLSGVRKALGVLRDYYGAAGAAAAAAMLQDGTSIGAIMRQPPKPEKHSKAEGAGTSIIGILEVVESDFASNLAKEETEEADAQSQYEKMTQENKVTKTIKDQDVKYKTQEIKGLDTSLAELTSDLETESAELSAVLEYYGKMKDRCIAKPETYEDRKKRREAEIAGLKEALAVLSDETAFVQRKRRGSFRGSALAP